MPARDVPLLRTVNRWKLVRVKLLELMEEITMCHSSLLSDTTRTCEDCARAACVIPCRRAQTNCQKALALMHQLVYFNSCLVSCYAQLVKRKAFKPKCFFCLRRPSAYRGGARQTAQYTNFLCADCSLSLVDPVFSARAYTEFVRVMGETMQKNGATESLKTVVNHQSAYKRARDLIESIPTSADMFEFTPALNKLN